MATTSNRTPAAEIQRQIAFQEGMKDRALTKYLAKVDEIDGKIETLKALKEKARLQDIRENGSEAWGDHSAQAKALYL